MTIYEARTAEYGLMTLSEAEGHISGSFVYAYPPDVPIIVPGEMITEFMVQDIEDRMHSGAVVKGLEDGMIRGLI